MQTANVFGLSIFGDGATIKKMPLINVIAAGVHNPSAVLDIVDTTGNSKNATYIAELFLNQINSLEQEYRNMYPGKEGVVDLAIFDGARNIQNAGTLMEQWYRKITTIHGGEHVLALFFKDCFTSIELKPLVYVHKLLYNFFGGSKHKPYAIFCAESKKHNNGKAYGILKVTPTRMGGFAIAWLRNLRLRKVFQCILLYPEYANDRDFKVSCFYP